MWALDTVLVSVVETALAVVISRDTEWKNKVQPVIGTVIELELTDFSKSLFFLPTAEGILVQNQFQSSVEDGAESNTVDVAIRGSISGFLKMLDARRKGEKVIGGDVKFEGDIGVGQQFEILMASLSPEWEESLSKIVGDPVARKISETTEELGKYLKKALKTIGENTGDYIHHEAQLSPPQIEVQNFTEDVGGLRSDLARLEARVRRLQKTKEDTK
jgi:ubiquinone biosynthesis protein UbiJ